MSGTTSINDRSSCIASGVAMVVYLAIGTVTFCLVETSERKKYSETPTARLSDMQLKLDTLSSALANGSGDIETQTLLALVNESQLLLSTLIESEKHFFIPWNFYTSFHFCHTAITTIGYGYITPSTQLGRGLAIPYILVGLPINLFFSVSFGYLLARGICKTYSLLAWVTRTLFRGRRNALGITELDANPTTDMNGNSATDCSDLGGWPHQGHSDNGLSTATVGKNGDFRVADFRGSTQINGACTSITAEAGGSNGNPSRCELESDEPCNAVKPRGDECEAIPLWFLAAFLSALTFLLAYVMYAFHSDSWTFLDCLYFVIVTFTTIGFGDMEFDTSTSKNYNSDVAIWWNIIYLSMLMQIGLVTMAGFITILSEKVAAEIKNAKANIKNKISSTPFIRNRGNNNDGDCSPYSEHHGQL